MLRSHRSLDPARIERTLRTDVYRFLLSEALRLGLVDEACMVWRADRDEVHQVGGVRVVLARSMRSVPAECRRGDLLFVRGDKRFYLPLLRHGRWPKWLFYAADETIVPRRTWGYDVVFCDEPRHLDLVRQRLPLALAARFIKTADPAVFHPLPSVAKAYDLCCFGNMDSPAKNYPALIPIVQKLPNLRCVIVGRPDPSLQAQLDRCSPHITYAGHLSQDQANQVINQSRVGLVLSVHDGAPRTILESMAAGLPQVVNAGIVAGSAYITPRAGRVVRLESFPEAIEDILASPRSFDPSAEFHLHYRPELAARQIFDRAAEAPVPSRPAWRQWWNHLPIHSRPGLRVRSDAQD